MCVRIHSVCELNSVYQFSALSCLIYGSSTWSTFLFSVYECAIFLFCEFFFTLLFATTIHSNEISTSLKRNCAYKSTLHSHTRTRSAMVAYRTLTQISLWLFCVFLLNESDRYYSSSSGERVCVCMTYTVRMRLEACVLAVGKKRKSMCAKRKSNSKNNSISIFLCSYNRNMIQCRLAITVIGPLCHIHLNTKNSCTVKIAGNYFS